MFSDLDGILTQTAGVHARYRGYSLDLRLTRDTLRVRGRDQGPVPIRLGFKNEVYEFAAGSTRVFKIE